MKKAVFKITSLFILVVFIFIKVINVHTYSHLAEDDHSVIENCQACEFQPQLDDDYLSAHTAYIAEVAVSSFLDQKITSISHIELIDTSFLGQNHNRPPPFF